MNESDDNMHTSTLAFAQEIARHSGEILLDGIGNARYGIRTKSSPTDVATDTDRKIEAFLEHAIHERFPEDTILGEEGAQTNGTSDRRWIIDPLDGSANFIRGLWPSVVSIAVEIKGQLTIGVVFDPHLDEMFAGELGSGATLNGISLRRDDHVDLTHAFVGISGSNRVPHRELRADIARSLASTADSVRDLGSTAAQLCAVAAGRLDAHVGIDVNIWDVAGGLVIAKAAGCVAEGLQPGSEATEQCALVAPPSLFPAIRSTVDSCRTASI